jgi:heat-inducible transcriptional repressor
MTETVHVRATAAAAAAADAADADADGDDGADTRELDPRKAAILEAVVAEYIDSAQPVGSHHVARSSAVNVSSATIRAEMAALEQEGFLVQPHTSAGRIPTDKGYRFFVDHLTEPGVLGPAQRQKVRRFFDHVHGEMEDLLERTSGLLADLTECAAVVVGPDHEQATLRSVQLVRLTPRLALLVAVLSDGAVEKRSIELTADTDDNTVAEVGGRLAAHVDAAGGWAPGGPAPTTSHGAPPAGTGTVADALLAAASAAIDEIHDAPRSADQVFVVGSSKVAEAFDAVETVRSVLSILEQQLVVVTLLRDVLGRGLSVAIGTEHGYEPLASCAVVVAPLSSAGMGSGAVGLLGPTRMDYPRALAAAHVVGQRLGERIEGGR